jgi:CheY-like chemotaxis protein
MKSDRAPLSCPPARILLAEDDDELRMLLTSRLRDAGFDVTEACDGKDLLERLIHAISPNGDIDPFDMVLSDINMPRFNALDVMIGARSCLTTTPVVLMTGFADAHIREQARRLGVMAVLDKPLRMGDLSATLVRILSGSSPPSRELW